MKAKRRKPASNTARKKNQRLPVLIVQHAHHEHPAAIRRALESQGIETLWIHPYRMENFPRLSEIRGIVSLGGPMGANDEKEHPWIKAECSLLRKSVKKGLPTVGICLGGQMMAKALGGKVTRNPVAEVGWFGIDLKPAGKKDRILGSAGSEPVVYQWHQDTFHLPREATLLASSNACPRQAYRVGDHAYGFQFHPEADHQLIHEWLDIEGVEDEILDVQKEHGPKTVQDADTQRRRAVQGEKASLKITAAIGQLFKDQVYDSSCGPRLAQLEKWKVLKTQISLEVDGPNGRIIYLRGVILMILHIQDGDFIIFKEQNTLLWPIRKDHIREAAAG